MKKVILKFKDQVEYQEWLSWQSWAVREKARIFSQLWPDIIPTIISVDIDESQTGEAGAGHIFLHPAGEELLKWVVIEYYGDYH